MPADHGQAEEKVGTDAANDPGAGTDQGPGALTDTGTGTDMTARVDSTDTTATMDSTDTTGSEVSSAAAVPSDSARASQAASAASAASAARHRTRRFPTLTKDTARPEGGGRAAPGDAPAPVRQWPMLAVLSGVGVGLLLTAFDVFRVGTLLVGLALIAGAVLRWALPSVGMLAVRSRFTDMVTYGVLGVAIALLAMMAQPNPWLEIPFLDDTLHFTIS